MDFDNVGVFWLTIGYLMLQRGNYLIVSNMKKLNFEGTKTAAHYQKLCHLEGRGKPKIWLETCSCKKKYSEKV
ncbi:MAG TPA: hypothetical protein DCM71_28365 [Runella sp.]|nr:hypothetical protein [Runella sp.]